MSNVDIAEGGSPTLTQEQSLLVNPSSSAQQKEYWKAVKCTIGCESVHITPDEECGPTDFCRVSGTTSTDELATVIVQQRKAHPDAVARYLNNELKVRTCLLDGDLRSRLDCEDLSEEDYRGEHFGDFNEVDDLGNPVSLEGNTELLNFTQADLITDIHVEYFKAGADICRTNTLNANLVSQKKYCIDSIIYEMNVQAAELAKKAAAQVTKDDRNKPRLVAGNIGPTCHSLSIAPHTAFPSFRNVTWDELVDCYLEQITGLMDGGVDLLMIDQACDGLNAKAAIYAVEEYFERTKKTFIPLIIGASIQDSTGRTQSGQTIEAFYASVKHAKPLSIGICGTGQADGAKQYYESLAQLSSSWCHLCPSADAEDPEGFAEAVLGCAANGLPNIVGGAAGVLPDHISKVAQILESGKQRKLPAERESLPCMLSGMDPCFFRPDDGLQIVGQRCRVSGSATFRLLVENHLFEDAVGMCLEQIQQKADILDINLDLEGLDGEWAMGRFLRCCMTNPKASKVPYMIGSTDWRVIEEGLKHVQGKCIVNAICVNQGDEEFLWMAKVCKRFGAAVIVSAIDENGIAQTYDDKTQICQNCYRLLRTDLDFPPEDIILDPNMWGIGTADSCRNGIDVINALKEIRRTCPSASLIGGLSNVSLLFTGNDAFRQAMHSLFLDSAIPAGLNLCIARAGRIPRPNDVHHQMQALCRDVILNKSADGEHIIRFVGFAAMMGALHIMPTSELPAPAPKPPPPTSRPMLLRTIVQAAGTGGGVSIFQMFGSKSHAAHNIHRKIHGLGVERNIMFSSISAWMGMGGNPLFPPQSAIMDSLAWWSRAQGLNHGATALQWGPVGDIGSRRAAYGSRDAMATGKLGMQLIMPPEAAHLLRVVCLYQQVPEFIATAFFEEETRHQYQRTTGGPIIVQDCFPEIKV